MCSLYVLLVLSLGAVLVCAGTVAPVESDEGSTDDDLDPATSDPTEDVTKSTTPDYDASTLYTTESATGPTDFTGFPESTTTEHEDESTTTTPDDKSSTTDVTDSELTTTELKDKSTTMKPYEAPRSSGKNKVLASSWHPVCYLFASLGLAVVVIAISYMIHKRHKANSYVLPTHAMETTALKDIKSR